MVKKLIRRHYGIADSAQIPTRYLVPASVVVAIVNTVIVMPLDCVKTHLEKVNPSATYRSAVVQIYQMSGNSFLGFFTGVRLRFLLYLTNALATVNLLEILENSKR